MNSPALRANFQKNYLMRYLVLTVVCLFLSAWFAYDGLIGYPQKLVYAKAYDELRELDSSERIDQWEQITKQNQWPAETPEKEAKEIESDIIGQYVFSGLALLVGIPALIFLLRSNGSWVESTETGLKTSWGQTLEYASVTRLNKKKWANKGIAKATYTADGQTRTFVFDDFKFDRPPLDQMLRDLESHLQPEQIVGGPPEPPLESVDEADPTSDVSQPTSAG
jgi:hypothetical protein